MAFVTDSNRPQPLRQPPPTACLTASGAASEVPPLPMHRWVTPSPNGGGGDGLRSSVRFEVGFYGSSAATPLSSSGGQKEHPQARPPSVPSSCAPRTLRTHCPRDTHGPHRNPNTAPPSAHHELHAAKTVDDAPAHEAEPHPVGVGRKAGAVWHCATHRAWGACVAQRAGGRPLQRTGVFRAIDTCFGHKMGTSHGGLVVRTTVQSRAIFDTQHFGFRTPPPSPLTPRDALEGGGGTPSPPQVPPASALPLSP